MNNNYNAFYYYRHQISKLVLVACGFLIPTIHILTLEGNEKADPKVIVIPILVSLLLIFVITSCRKIMLGKLMCCDLDFKMIYELDKRKNTPRNRYYNLKLLMRVYLYSGDFSGVLELSNVVVSSEKYEDRFFATHMRILALFFMGEYKDLNLLIDSQKRLLGEMKIVESDEYFRFYSCIESFIYGEYNNTICIATNIVSQGDIEKLNHRKILFFYVMRMASVQLNDADSTLLYSRKIMECDPKRNTFFSWKIQDN